MSSRHARIENSFGRFEVRFLRAAEPIDRAREEGAHAAIRDDRRPRAEPLEEPAQSCLLIPAIVGVPIKQPGCGADMDTDSSRD